VKGENNENDDGQIGRSGDVGFLLRNRGISA
jgi:hypothetical protein